MAGTASRAGLARAAQAWIEPSRSSQRQKKKKAARAAAQRARVTWTRVCHILRPFTGILVFLEQQTQNNSHPLFLPTLPFAQIIATGDEKLPTSFTRGTCVSACRRLSPFRSDAPLPAPAQSPARRRPRTRATGRRPLGSRASLRTSNR